MSEETCTCRDGLDIEKMVPRESPRKWNASGLRAEIRAIEQGHRAFLIGAVVSGRVRSAHKAREVLDRAERIDFRVVSNCRHGLTHVQHVHLKPGSRLPIKVVCTCESGKYREWAPIPCKHAALVARRLERERLVEWHDGLWWHPECWTRKEEHAAATAHIDEHPDDPFEGLGLE